MADDINDTLKSFLATEPGSLGLKDTLARLEEENKQLESELERVKQNRDNLIREKRMLQGRPDKALRGTDTELFMSAADALDPAEYRRMRDLAEQQGKRLRIVSEGSTTSHDASPVKYLEDRDFGILYANGALRDRVGVQRLNEIAKERGLKSVKTFRSTDHLPDHLHRAHAQTIIDGDRANLMEG